MNAEKYDNEALNNGYARWWLPLVVLLLVGAAVVVTTVMALPADDLPLPDPQRPLPIRIMLAVMYLIIFIVMINLIRHYYFTLNRLFGRQRHPYLDIDTAVWPKVTILIPAHNEERVIADILEAMLEVDYPHDRLHIVPLNDRSEDGTAEIIDKFAAANPDFFKPFHRKDGMAGKAAAMQDALEMVDDDIILVFDADYIPGRGVIKQLVAPFFDPEVGAVMGRVVPLNAGTNLLTRTLDLERAGGYQVDQQARMNLKLVPQYGGTVGGVRRLAVEAVGGWDVRSLAEDTDMTLRLLLAGWKTVYQNRCECYEQVPETWRTRMRQIYRWSRGHNQVLRKYAGKLLVNKYTRLAEKIDGVLLLHIYLMSLILVVGWTLGIILWYQGVTKPGLIIILAVTCYSTLGNFAIFFEIATATYLDGSRSRVRLLPFIMPGFLVSLMSVARATVTQPFARRSKDLKWHKTERSQRSTKWE